MAIHRRPSWKLLFFILLLLLSGVLVFAAISGILSVREFLRLAGTDNHLQQIQLALGCYRQTYGCYPPQYLTDRQGRPAHSWRVLLLPDLGYNDLFRQYRFDEPWNGPHNRLLATEMPYLYRSPFLDSRSTITQYVGIAGKGTAWGGATALDDASALWDPEDSRIWFVEAANSDIQWMEPRNIPLEQALVGINVPGGGGIQSNYSDGLPAQMMPYGQRLVPAGISPDAFRALLTIPGGKKKEADIQPFPRGE